MDSGCIQKIKCAVTLPLLKFTYANVAVSVKVSLSGSLFVSLNLRLTHKRTTDLTEMY